jgi:hypothetical protein
MSETKQTTSVQEVDADLLNDILGTGAESVMLAGEEKPAEKKNTIFSPVETDLTFLDKPDPIAKPDDQKTQEELDAEAEAKKLADEGKTPEEIAAEAEAAAAAEPVIVDDPLAQPSGEEDLLTEEDKKNKGGRPNNMVAATKNLIKEGLLQPFVLRDDKGNVIKDKDGNPLDEPVDNYTAKDFEELIKSNIDHTRESVANETPEKFFNSLPEEMQLAYDHMLKGGSLKDIVNVLSQSNEIRDLDITKEADQKHAIRAYLTATNYGTPDEIEDELYGIEDRGDLEKKASQFKPKLDAMQQSIVNQKLADQEAQAKLRQEQSQKYIESVYSTLDSGKLNGLELDNKTQNMLYSGLVQSNHPSMSGKQTNMLGHLLEKYQWVEPRHDLIAEALWLLSDPEGYRSKIGQGVEKQVNADTMRTLKTEAQQKTIANTAPEEKESGVRRSTGRIERPTKNFFKR